ncbi:MAG: hypothetical protein ABIJ34_00760 [archaeon]
MGNIDHDYDDPVKQLSRAKQQEFEDRFLPKDKSEIKVLCLPGRKGLELSIYDNLGIERRNIYGVESDYDCFCDLRDLKSSIALPESNIDLETFLLRAIKKRQQFGIIAIDHTSFLNQRRWYELQLIASYGLLGDNGILITNFQAAREDNDTKNFLKRVSQTSKRRPTRNDILLRPEKTMREISDTEFSLAEDRSRTIRDLIIGTFLAGRLNLRYDILIKSVLGYENLTHEFTKECLNDPILRKEIEWIYGRNIQEKFMRHQLFGIAVLIGLQETLVQSAKGHSIEDKMPAIRYVYEQALKYPYFITDSESYRYISNSGTPMFMDMFKMTHLTELQRMYEEMVYCDKKPGTVSFFPDLGRTERNNRFLQTNLASQIYLEFQQKSLAHKERIYLGSSAKRERREKITKDDAIGLLEVGYTPEEIAEIFTGFTDRQLAAFKAHITMGTYR